MPMFELIATVAHPFPTPNGLYRTHQEDAIVRSYLKAVRRIKVLVLDVQPGRDDFVSSLRHWEPYLRQPDVGIALDPEFAMGPGQVPGKQLGRTDAAAINRASAYVAGIVKPPPAAPEAVHDPPVPRQHDHDKAKIAIRPGLAMTWNADGFGVRSAKLEDYRSYTRDRRFHPGLKLFYENDVNLMRPREVLRLKPVPRVINYHQRKSHDFSASRGRTVRPCPTHPTDALAGAEVVVSRLAGSCCCRSWPCCLRPARRPPGRSGRPPWPRPSGPPLPAVRSSASGAAGRRCAGSSRC